MWNELIKFRRRRNHPGRYETMWLVQVNERCRLTSQLAKLKNLHFINIHSKMGEEEEQR